VKINNFLAESFLQTLFTEVVVVVDTEMLIDSEGYKAKQRKGREEVREPYSSACEGGAVCQAMSATRVRTKGTQRWSGEARHGGKGSPGASGASSRTSNI
jgi:hypothetical protein